MDKQVRTPEEAMDAQIWGASGICRETFEFILSKIPLGSTVVETGSGYVSTRIIGEFYDLYSIEDKEQFANLYNAKYIVAPLIDGWYDWEIVEPQLPESCALCFVDGPTGSGNRWKIIERLQRINAATYIVHDTDRPEELKLAEAIAKATGKQMEVHTEGDFWTYIF